MFSIADLLRGTGIDLNGCENIYADMPILSPQATTDNGTNEAIGAQIGTGKNVAKAQVARKRRRRSRRVPVKRSRMQPMQPNQTVHRSGVHTKQYESSDDEPDDNVDEEYYVQCKNYRVFGEALSTSKRFKSTFNNVIM